MTVASICSSAEATPPHDDSPVVFHEGGRTVVWLAGDQDMATAPALADTLDRAGSAGDADLIVDLSGVAFIDASTIGVLVRSRNSLHAKGRSLTLRSPTSGASRVLEVCRLGWLVDPRPLAVSRRALRSRG